jgi:ornithine cyclodeaminase/alanine dehydrogenase-like protein (mu-crystallin family)
VVKSKFFADHREATLNEAGDFLIPRGEGAVTDAHIQAELADVVLGRHAGRTSPDEITLFKSLGLAVEDLGSAMHIYRKAVEQGVGVKVDL